MNKFLLLFFAFYFGNSVEAQLYVSPSSYVYVSDKYLYVKQNTNIQSSGNIYLRNDSQLLQATAGTSTNTGAGTLSAFQEGSVNNYQYNYWCSPVGNASAAVGNESFGITMLNMPTNLTSSTAATILAMNNYDGTSSPLAIAPYWIWKFLSSSTYSQWFQVGSASTIGAGEGFTMKGTSGTDATTILGVQNNPGATLPLFSGNQRYDFRGKPNDGNITINVANGQTTLTGNPYPSAIDLSAFLTAATNSTGVAYFWESDKTINSHFVSAYQGGYGTFSPVSRGGSGIYVPATFYGYDGAGNQLGAVGSGNSYQRRFSPIGQGFMITGNTNGTVQMNNSYRVYVKEGAANLSQFEKNTNSSNSVSDFLPEIPSVSGYDYTTVSRLATPQIRFKATIDNSLVGQLALAFSPEATDGVDFAMDAKSANDDMAQEFYFALNNQPYVINVINFDINKKIPVGFRNTNQSNYKVSVSEILNFTGAQNVYMHDKVNDVYYDVKNDVFDVTLPPGNNVTQYEITFINSNLSTENNVNLNFDIVQNNTNQLLNISNPNALEIKEVSLFDVAGKLIFSKTKLGSNSSYQFSTSGLSEGVYIVNLTTIDNKKEGKKISIFRSN